MWQNATITLLILFVPILIAASVLLTIGFKISDQIQSIILAFSLIIGSILLVAAMGVGWIQVLMAPCGYVERHFPVEDHIEGFCDDVG